MPRKNRSLFNNFMRSIGMSFPKAAFLAEYWGEIMKNSEEYAEFLKRLEIRLLAEAE